jgi:hypothetical protein
MTTPRNSTIHSMALVCRDFYHHLFPLLFENVYTCGSDATLDENEGEASHCARFCRSIVHGDERARRLATYTKRFAIVSLKVGKKYQAAHSNHKKYLIAEPDPGNEPSLSTFSKALSHMANLQELYLFHTSITNDLLQSVVCLPSLSVLLLEYCDVSKALDAGLLAKFSNLHVARVFVEHEISYGDAVPYESFTRHLCMSRAERFVSDVCVEGHVLRGLAASPSPMQYLQIFHLETVHIDRAHPELISNVLAVMPTLISCHIAEIRYRGGHWDLHEELAYQFNPCSSYPALPHLVHIHAPLSAVQALVPDSNVVSIGFSHEYLDSSRGLDIEYASDDEFWHDCAFFLNKAKRHMSCLEIPMSFYQSVHFATYFPELRRLKVRARHRNWQDSSFSWPPEPVRHSSSLRNTGRSLIRLSLPAFLETGDKEFPRDVGYSPQT